MRKGALMLVAAVGAALVAAMAQAQPLQPLRRDAETAALEKRIALLEQQNAELRRFILVNGDNVTIRAPQTLSLQAGPSLEVRAQGNLAVKAGAEGKFESGGATRIRGGIVTFNNGTRPLARLGDPVQVTPSTGVGNIKQGSATVLAD